MFGGGSSALRRGRMLSATPYSAALRNREREREKARPQAPPTAATPAPTTDAMSSTARVILDTLDKMSTPIQDARKIPVPRAEKRKMIEDELNCSLGGSSRRRPRLGSGVQAILNGPPLRKNYSPVPVRGSAIASRLGAPSTSSAGLDYEKEGAHASGKMRAKVSEKGRAKAMQGLEESESTLPTFLTASVPTLDIKFDKLPEFDLKVPIQAQAKVEKVSQKTESNPKPISGGFNFEPGTGGFSLKSKIVDSSLEPKGFNFEPKSGGFIIEPKIKSSVSSSPKAVTPSANKLPLPNTNAVKPMTYSQEKTLNSLEPKHKPPPSSFEPPKSVEPKLPSPLPVVLPVNNLKKTPNSSFSSTSVNEKLFRYSFSPPELVSKGETKPVSAKYTFCSPEQVGAVTVNGKCKNSESGFSSKNADTERIHHQESGYSSKNSSFSSVTKVPIMMNHVTNLSPRRKESSLPDVANNVMMFGQGGKQGVDVVRDSPSSASNRLPDVTTSTGFGSISASPSTGFGGLSASPSSGFGGFSGGFGGFSSAPTSGGFGAAKELKSGSVMDILGKK